MGMIKHWPKDKYNVIYVDPPWNFKSNSIDKPGKNARKYYETMSLADIRALPVPSICKDDCVLLLWTTDPFLQHAMGVIHAWGFKYKTVGFYWAKQNKVSDGWFKGTGYWTRANPELCLLATKGKPKRVGKSVDKLVVSRRREHSRKPDEVYDRIESLLQGPYIELFARTDRAGWDSWGNEVGKFEEDCDTKGNLEEYF